LFSTDVPYGSNQISRFGVEETVVDGVIMLTSTQEGFERQRYLEVYKLRNTAHSKGRHNVVIGTGGVQIFPRYASNAGREPARGPKGSRRLASGVSGLDPLIGGGFLPGSVTLLSGTSGAGKTTAALQFIIEGAKRKEPGLYVALEEGRKEILRTATELGMPLKGALEQGMVEIGCLSREHVRANQLLTILADKIRANGTRRLSLDSASYLMTEGLSPLDARQVLRGLITGFKTEGVTSCFTLELGGVGTGSTAERGLSSLADNVILLRPAETPGGLKPTLTVVKTRSSSHDFGTHEVTFAKGGLRIEPVAKRPRRRG
jgi:circadian clock protein KaiC